MFYTETSALTRDEEIELLKLLEDEALDAERALQADDGGLSAFVRYFWHILEPATPLVEDWPLEALCLHLEAITAGRIPKFLANVPPGFMKSLLVNVFWPAWEWGPKNLPHLRYVTFSYAAHLTERDNRRFLTLLESPKYQRMWGDRFKLVKQGETLVSNDKMGWKLATSFGGIGTGERGDRVILDDPHNVKEAESEKVRESVVTWFRESMSNRLNDLKKSVIIVIMQRVHETDVSGEILSAGLDYVHLMIPMEFDSARRCRTSIGWVDPRKFDGQLAWPGRFPADELSQFKSRPFMWAGQYQQTPEARGGGIIKRDWWESYITDDGKIPACTYVVASLDPAYEEDKENDPSGFTIWGVWYDEKGHSKIIALTSWRKRLDLNGWHEEIARLPGEAEGDWVRRTQKSWGLIQWVVYSCNRFRVHKLLIEAKASGITVSQEISKLSKNSVIQKLDYSVQLMNPGRQDKVARLHAVSHLFTDGMIMLPTYSDGTYREWGQQLVDEVSAFPKGATDDLTDSMTQALRHIRDIGLAVRRDERATAERELGRHKSGKASPLYPV